MFLFESLFLLWVLFAGIIFPFLLVAFTSGITKGCVLFRWGAIWIGMHYSPNYKRWCVNILPFVTVCYVLEGGKLPYAKR